MNGHLPLFDEGTAACQTSFAGSRLLGMRGTGQRHAQGRFLSEFGDSLSVAEDLSYFRVLLVCNRSCALEPASLRR